MAEATNDLVPGPDPSATPAAKKPYGQILFEEISQGRHELRRPPLGLFMSGLSAGLDIGFSIFVIAVMRTLIGDSWSPAARELLIANCYPIGFLFVVLGRSELFTEHTSLAVLPMLSGQATVSSVARLWALVFGANLLGTLGFAALMVNIGPAIQVLDADVLRRMARAACTDRPLPMFASGVLAAWLMGLLSWLVTAARDTISQVVVVWVVAAVIGLARLHHAILGSVTMLSGVFTGAVTWLDYGYFMLWTTLGNAVGGVVFVALLKYGHASRGPARPKRGRRR